VAMFIVRMERRVSVQIELDYECETCGAYYEGQAALAFIGQENSVFLCVACAVSLVCGDVHLAECLSARDYAGPVYAKGQGDFWWQEKD